MEKKSLPISLLEVPTSDKKARTEIRRLEIKISYKSHRLLFIVNCKRLNYQMMSSYKMKNK